MMAVKPDIGTSWHAMTVQRRLLKRIGAKYSSEKKSEKREKKILKDHLTAEMISFEERDDKGKGYQVDKPAVYVKDLSQYVLDMLDDYAQAKKLIWKDKPEDKVWLKIGGDHGQGSFKVCIQIANTHHPNLKHNTICVSVFKAKDYYPNTVKMLDY